MKTSNRKPGGLSRRAFVATAAAACAVTARTATTRRANAQSSTPPGLSAEIPPQGYRAANGRIKHSIMAWCFNPIPAEELIEACRRVGMSAMEGIGREYYPQVRAAGMAISLVSSHGFKKGPLSRENHAYSIEKLREAIDVAAQFECHNVITFTGMREAGVTDEQAKRNCVDCWKQVIGYAEQKKINLCLEHLNTRDDTHPMKGHPGYFGNDVDLCVDLIRQVDSPRMKLLFDIYHVQIMNGDLIRRIRQYKDYIGHYHTAGVPGRGEMDQTQEVNYPAVMRAIVETGYTGYVAQEFIPTWEDKLGAMRHGVRVCDV
jgi:hydroxypyruvate isomerase